MGVANSEIEMSKAFSLEGNKSNGGDLHTLNGTEWVKCLILLLIQELRDVL